MFLLEIIYPFSTTHATESDNLIVDPASCTFISTEAGVEIRIRRKGAAHSQLRRTSPLSASARVVHMIAILVCQRQHARRLRVYLGRSRKARCKSSAGTWAGFW